MFESIFMLWLQFYNVRDTIPNIMWGPKLQTCLAKVGDPTCAWADLILSALLKMWACLPRVIILFMIYVIELDFLDSILK